MMKWNNSINKNLSNEKTFLKEFVQQENYHFFLDKYIAINKFTVYNLGTDFF